MSRDRLLAALKQSQEAVASGGVIWHIASDAVPDERHSTKIDSPKSEAAPTELSPVPKEKNDNSVVVPR